MNAADVDDAAAVSVFKHAIHGPLSEEEITLECVTNQMIPEFLGDLREVHVARCHGIVDEDVDTTVLLDEFVEHTGAILSITNISLMPRRFSPERFDGCDRLIGFVVSSDVINPNICPMLGKQLSNTRANAST
jgi:hypothetical protein